MERSAIALNRLGTGFDVQGGGADLIFPHHEFSAAHAEALTGAHPMARHYVHTGMIGLGGEKISKSQGNLVFVSRLRADGVLDEAVARLARWRAAVALPAGASAQDAIDRLRLHLADDLNTLDAVAAVDHWATETLARRGPDPNASTLMITAVDALLGIAL